MYPGRVCKAKVLRLNFVTLSRVVVSVLAFECRRSLVLIPGHVKHETIKLVCVSSPLRQAVLMS